MGNKAIAGLAVLVIGGVLVSSVNKSKDVDVLIECDEVKKQEPGVEKDKWIFVKEVNGIKRWIKHPIPISPGELSEYKVDGLRNYRILDSVGKINDLEFGCYYGSDEPNTWEFVNYNPRANNLFRYEIEEPNDVWENIAFFYSGDVDLDVEAVKDRVCFYKNMNIIYPNGKRVKKNLCFFPFVDNGKVRCESSGIVTVKNGNIDGCYMSSLDAKNSMRLITHLPFGGKFELENR